MRKFTKGLLMTFIASAVSLGASAQEIDGYYRVINAGYVEDGTGVVKVFTPTTAQPQITRRDAVTLPGTVMYIKAAVDPANSELAGQYMDINASDLKVENLRSQAVDACAAVYGPLVETLKFAFQYSLNKLNEDNKWGFSDDDKAQILEDMFDAMKMYLEPVDVDDPTEIEDLQQVQAYYLKSTTPNTKPLADAIIEAGGSVEGLDMTDRDLFAEGLWEALFTTALTYFDMNGEDQIKAEFEYFKSRIHMGHTYYLIGGRVDYDWNSSNPQKFNKGKAEGAFISFANKNMVDFPIAGLTPEIEVARNYSKWYLEPVVVRTGDEARTKTDYFAIKGSVPGNDGKYYSTIYTDFPIKLVENGEKSVKAWGIVSAPVIGSFGSTQPNPNDDVAYVTTINNYNETGIIPARTPVVIECTATAAMNNILEPTSTPLAEEPHGESFLKGIFFPASFDIKSDKEAEEFEYFVDPLGSSKKIARKLVRVFNRGKNTLNPVGFFKYDGDKIADNKAFMILESSMANANVVIVDAETYADGINEVATENTNSTVYDIQGRVVTNPTKGLYIVNGKKVVIK